LTSKQIKERLRISEYLSEECSRLREENSSSGQRYRVESGEHGIDSVETGERLRCA
jgi:hypothetical protein